MTATNRIVAQTGTIFALAFSLTGLWSTQSPSTATAWEYWRGFGSPDIAARISGFTVDSEGNTYLSLGIVDGDAVDIHVMRKISPSGIDLWEYSNTRRGTIGGARIDASGDVIVAGSNNERSPAGPYVMKLSGVDGKVLWGGLSAARSDPQYYLRLTGLKILPDGDILTSWSNDHSPTRLERLSPSTGSTISSVEVAEPRLGGFLLAPDATFFEGHNTRDGLSMAIGQYSSRDGSLGPFGTRTFRQEFDPRMGFDRDGNLIVGAVSPTGIALHKVLLAEGSSWDAKLDIAEEGVGFQLVIGEDGNIFTAVHERRPDDTYVTRLLAFSGIDGTVLSDSEIPNEVTRLAGGPNGTFIAAGSTAIRSAHSRAWIASIAPDFRTIAWDRTVTGPDGDEYGFLTALALHGDDITVAGLVASGRMVGCDTCRLREVVISRLSALDGSDSQPCGNGVLDQGEQCDDGNREAADDCPSRSSNGCRYTTLLTRGLSTTPARDRKSCKSGWFVTGDNADVRDRYGLKRGRVTCVDNDPSCDFDPTEGVCGFRVATCFNNQSFLLPACTADDIASISVATPKFAPRLARDEHPTLINDTLSGLLATTSHLLDPANPDAGYSTAAPIRREQINVCSRATTITVPVALTSDVPTQRRIAMMIKTKGQGSDAPSSKAKLSLTCKPRPTA